MKKKFSSVILIFLFASSNLFCEILKWDIKNGDRLEIVKTADVDYLLNNKLEETYYERNIIDLTCFKKEDMQQSLKGVFSLYKKNKSETTFKKTDSYNSTFSISNDGQYVVSSTNVMPNERNIPTFPQKELKTTDEWTAPAQIILNVFSKDIIMNIPVNYRLGEIKEKNGIKYAIIFYAYIYKENFTDRNSYAEDVPDGIVIQNEGVFLWNLTQNIPVASEDNYYTAWLYLTSMNSYSTIEHKMKMKADYKIYPTITEDQKEKAKTELEKNLNAEKGISVSKNESGLVIRMGEILFDFNSSSLKNDTRVTLEKIADVIKSKYPDNEIIIEGYTDNVGTDEYNLQLSEKRAKSVADYIKSKIIHDKLSYKGFGKDKPLNSNKDSEERKLNRRVDIIIKLN